MINRPVLVLNNNYEPLNICRVKRAVPLIYLGKAEMVENGVGFIRTSRDSFAVPTVIRLHYIIKRPYPQIKLTRIEIFNRDHFTCQYCGKKKQPLTLDHVVPRHQGGSHTWENVVSACNHCNRRKAGRTPKQAGMELLNKPKRPDSRLPFYISPNYLDTMTNWHKYLPQ